MVVAVFYILRNHYRNAYSLEHLPEKSNGKPAFRMILAEEVSFLNKGSILKTLNNVEEGSAVVIDASNTKIIDHDVIEVIKDFSVNAKRRNINVELKGLNELHAGKPEALSHKVGHPPLAKTEVNSKL